MKTLSLNIKKITLSLLFVGLVIGASAYKNAHNNTVKITRNAEGKIISVTASYYNISGDKTSTNPLNFIFRDGTTPAGCSSLTNKECSAQWTTTNMPHNNQSPSDAGAPTLSARGTVGLVYNGQ